MKWIFRLHFFLVFLFSILSCKSGSDKNDSLSSVPENTSTHDWTKARLTEFDLSAKGFPLTIQAPENVMIYNIKSNGRNVLVIQPTDQSPVRMNVFEDSTNFNALKPEIEKSTGPEFDQWILIEENGGIYTVLYPDGIEEFRFVYFFKSLTKNYHCDWDMIAELTRAEAETFYKMAKTIKTVGTGQ